MRVLAERLRVERTRLNLAGEVDRIGRWMMTSPKMRVKRRACRLAPENAGDMVAHFADLTPRVPAPSLALVNKVVQHLANQAFLEQLPNRGFRVRDNEGLLQAWRGAYRFDRHSRRPYFTLLQGRALHDRLRTLDPDIQGRFAYAALSAADLQAPAVRQARTWLYLSR